jgi:hypothetical protein
LRNEAETSAFKESSAETSGVHGPWHYQK